MDGGAWQATVHGVAKSQTRLSDLAQRHMHSLGLVLTHSAFESNEQVHLAQW